jgi:hypothetical protein
MILSRKIGDSVRINPYSKVTGEIISRKDSSVEKFANFDYKVKLNIPHVDKETIFSACYDPEEKYWWNYFNEDELDKLERNYELFSR